MSRGGEVPDPPAAKTPRVVAWPAGARLWHVYRRVQGRGPRTFNASGTPRRFGPIFTPGGDIVPTWYGADREVGAFFETLFRAWNEPPPGGPSFAIGVGDIAYRSITQLVLRRELRLARLFGEGLVRLQVTREKLIEPSGPDAYRQTARWGEWLHRCKETLDGIAWVSRRNDDVHSCLLFGDRVQAADLDVVSDSPLDDAPGFARVQAVASDCGIAVACTLFDVFAAPPR